MFVQIGLRQFLGRMFPRTFAHIDVRAFIYIIYIEIITALIIVISS